MSHAPVSSSAAHRPQGVGVRLVVVLAAMVFLMILVILTYATWSSRSHWTSEAVGREAQAYLRHQAAPAPQR
jgi:hypothetical protein